MASCECTCIRSYFYLAMWFNEQLYFHPDHIANHWESALSHYKHSWLRKVHTTKVHSTQEACAEYQASLDRVIKDCVCAINAVYQRHGNVQINGASVDVVAGNEDDSECVYEFSLAIVCK